MNDALSSVFSFCKWGSSELKKLRGKNQKAFYLGLAILSAALLSLFLGIKAILIFIALALFGALSNVANAFIGLPLAIDFALFSGIIGAYLFGGWAGAIVIMAEYVIISKTPLEDVEYPVALWYAIVVSILLPKLWFSNSILNLILAGILGEIGNLLYWLARGIPFPYQAFYGIVKMGWYSLFFAYVLPDIVRFVG